uniref:Uncharacterized protein n=1 Tax=Rhizophora mucronata TaxID=61149 RepID=A0A2P2PD69_RHIMU
MKRNSRRISIEVGHKTQNVEIMRLEE